MQTQWLGMTEAARAPSTAGQTVIREASKPAIAFHRDCWRLSECRCDHLAETRCDGDVFDGAASHEGTGTTIGVVWNSGASRAREQNHVLEDREGNPVQQIGSLPVKLAGRALNRRTPAAAPVYLRARMPREPDGPLNVCRQYDARRCGRRPPDVIT